MELWVHTREEPDDREPGDTGVGVWVFSSRYLAEGKFEDDLRSWVDATPGGEVEDRDEAPNGRFAVIYHQDGSVAARLTMTQAHLDESRG